MAAIGQVVATGQQTLVLNSQGTAVGGSLTVLPQTISSLGSLNLPANVAINSLGFSAASPFVINGATVVSGALLALQPASGLTSVLNLGSLTVNPGGLVSGGLPAGYLIPGAFASNGLVLNVARDVLNQGTITSAGTLSINSGGNIYNQSTAGMQALISAQTVNLMAGAATITNSGLITATANSLNMTTRAMQDLVINNAGGRLEALSGVINVRDSLFSGKYNLSISGGALSSKALNLYSGDGIVSVDVNNLLGTVNVQAGEAHITASCADLRLGTIDLSGDPTFYNQNGNVTISGNLTYAGQNLAIVASGNIVTAAGAGTINTSSAGGSGGAVTMIAGAAFSPAGQVQPTPPPNPPTGDTATTLTITGGSTTGGKIDLSTGTPITTFSTQSTGANGNGGKVTLLALTGTSAGSGTITLPTGLNLLTGGNNTGSNGDVTMIAGATSGTAITSGLITTSGGAGGTGNITVKVATPTVSSLTIRNGAITGGSYGAGSLQGGSIALGDGSNISLTARRAVIDLEAGGNITTQAPGNINNASATGTGTGNGGTVTVLAGGTVTTDYIVADAVGIGNGGTVTISGTSVLIGDSGGNQSISANARTTGSGGIINITANSASQFAIGGGAGCTNCTVDRLRANAAGSGDGGRITVSNLGAGGISVPSNSNDLQARAAGSGAGGYINLDASLASPGPLSLLAGTYDVSAGGGLGGTLLFKGSTFVVTGGAPAVLRADGATTGAGGTISVIGTAATADITIGNAAGNIDLSADGGGTNGNAGTIQVYAGRNLTVDVARISALVNGANGAGATLDLKAGAASAGNLYINGSLAASGKGTGNGGNVTLTSNSATVFDVRAAAATNGVNGTVTAAAGATSGAGGQVRVINNGSGGISLGAPANINVAASAGGGAGGTISLDATAGPVDGPITIPTGTLAASAAAGNSPGGVLSLAASTLSVTGAGALTLSANATGTGNGGTVSVTTTGAAASLNVGSAAGQVIVSAKGGSGASGSGDGGAVTLSAGRNLSIAGGSLSAMPQGTNGKGPVISLTAGTAAAGGLSLTGALNASGVGSGSGGTVTMTASTAGSAVSIASAASVTASLSGGNITVNTGSYTNNGSLTASNAGGGLITVESAGALTVSGTGSQTLNGAGGGAITVSAGGANTLAFNGAQTFNPSSSGTVVFAAPAAGAAITVASGITETVGSGAPLSISTPALRFLGNNSQVSASGASNISVNSGVAGNNLTLQAPSGFTTAGIVTAGGSIAIAPAGTGALTFDKSGAAATTLNLNAGTGSVSTTTSAATTVNSLVTVSANANLSMTALGAALTDNGAIVTASNKNITLTARTLDYRTGTVNAGNGIVTLQPDGNFAITAGSAVKGAGFDITAAELAVTTAGELVIGNIGRDGGITVTGDINSSGVGPAGAWNLTFKNFGSFDATGRTLTVGTRNLTIDVLGTAALGNISATTGNIFVRAASLSIDTALTVASPGTVTLMTYAGSAGSISLNAAVVGGAAATISADGAGSISQTAGTVAGTTVSLASGSGDIGSSAVPIITAATGTLSATTGGSGNVYLYQAGAVTLGNSSAGDGRFELSSTGLITVAGNLTASGANAYIYLTSPGINITGWVNAGASGWVQLAPNVASGVTVGGSAAIAGYPYLVSSSSLSKITAYALFLNVNAGAGGGGDIKFQGDPATPTILDLSGSNVAAYMFWNSTGNIINTGNTIKLGTPLVDNKGKFMFNLASGNINSGSISGTNYVGLIASGTLTVDGNVDVRSILPGVDGYVDFWGQTGLTVNGNVAGSPLSINSNYVRLTAGPIPWWNNFNSHPVLNILDGPAPASRVSIVAHGGDLQLRNTDDSTTSFGQRIAIGKNVNLEADWKDFSGPGNVHIFFTQGDSDPRPFTSQAVGTNPYPAAITVNKTTSVTKGGATVGEVYFNDNTGISLQAGATNIVLNAKGTKISLDARPVIGGLTLAGSISLDSNLTITADPPDDFVLPSAVEEVSPVVASLVPVLQVPFEFSTILPTDTTRMSATIEYGPKEQSDKDKSDNAGKQTGLSAMAKDLSKDNSLIAGSWQEGQLTWDSTALVGERTATAVVRHLGSAQLDMVSADMFSLRSGEILLIADKTTRLSAGDVLVNVEAGSVVLVNRNSDELTVSNILDVRAGSVKLITADRHSLELPVGTQASIGRTRSSTLMRSGRGDAIARRHLQAAYLSGGQTVTTSEVFYLSLVQHSDLLKQLTASSKPEDRKLSARLLKTAAVIAVVGARRGPYSAGR